MNRKRIVVMGFMGSCPIAGVIWQHVHYIVGLQRLGHEVYYIEDSARIPYNAETFDTSNDYTYAAKLLARLASEFDFKNRWSFCARYLPELPTAGLPLRGIRQLYKSADAILNICGTQEFNDDLLASDRILYVESDPGVEQIKVDRGSSINNRLSRTTSCAFYFWRKRRNEKISGADPRIEVAPNAAADCHRSLENPKAATCERGLHIRCQLVDQRIERHHLARREISLE